MNILKFVQFRISSYGLAKHSLRFHGITKNEEANFDLKMLLLTAKLMLYGK